MEPSQADANKVVAKLLGVIKKYTITVYMKSGRVYEYQSDKEPAIAYASDLRADILRDQFKDYTSAPIAMMADVEFINTQENPK